MPLASDFGTGQVFLSMLWFFLFFIWIWLLIVVFSDLFRSHDLGGWAKAFWVIGIIILPYLGVLLYLIVRGHKMAEHAQQAAAAQDAAAKAYIQQAAGTTRQHGRRDPASRRPQGAGRDQRRRVRGGQGQGAQSLTPPASPALTRGPGFARGLVASRPRLGRLRRSTGSRCTCQPPGRVTLGPVEIRVDAVVRSDAES